MATSIRGRGARRTAPHTSKQLVDRLEPRQLLAVTTLKDFGGLPREVTGVGSFVYFALDEKVDGRLSYVDLVGYNVKKGKQQSIRKPDGSKFGQTQYYLSEANDKLVIRESQKGGSPDRFYTLNPGQTRTTEADASAGVERPVGPIPRTQTFKLSDVKSIAPLGTDRLVFVARDGKRSRLFTMDASGGSVRMLDVPATRGFTSFTSVAQLGNGRLLATFSSVDAAGPTLLSTNGRPDGTTLISTGGEPASLLSIEGGKALLRIGASFAVSDGTDVGTVRVRLLNGSVPRMNATPRLHRIGGRVVVAPPGSGSTSTDPETRGPYVDPFSGSSGSITTIATGYIDVDDALSIDVEHAEAEELFGISSIQHALPLSESQSLIAQNASTSTSTEGAPTRYKLIDGTGIQQPSGNSLLVGAPVAPIAFESWRNAVSAAGRIVFSSSWDSGALSVYTPETANLSGRVVTDTGLRGELRAGVSGFKVFVDRDNDGAWSKREPLAVTDYWGRFSFRDVAPGDYVVRTFNYTGQLEAISRATLRVSVSAGETRDLPFVVHDGTFSGRVAGDLYASYQVPVPDARVFVDLDDDGTLDAGEPSAAPAAAPGASSGESLAYRIDGLRAGTYRVRLIAPNRGVAINDSASLVRTLCVPFGGKSNDDELWGSSFTTVLTALPSRPLNAITFIDDDVDGRRDGQESTLAYDGVQLHVDLDEDGRVDADEPLVEYKYDEIWWDTQISGEASFGNLATGEYLVRATAPEGYAFTTPAVQRVTISNKGGTVSVGLRPANGEVRVKAFVDVDRDGAFTASVDRPFESPLYLDLDDNGALEDPEPVAYSSEVDGFAVFTGLPRRGFVIRFAQPGSDFSSAVRLTDSRRVSSSASLIRPGSIDVRLGVWRDQNANGRRDAGEQISGREISLHDNWSYDIQATDASGVARFAGIVDLNNASFDAGPIYGATPLLRASSSPSDVLWLRMAE